MGKDKMSSNVLRDLICVQKFEDHDVLESIRRALPTLNIKDNERRNVLETFRRLNVQLPLGRLGKSDTSECRVAVCLQHVLRVNGGINIHIPSYDMLARAVGIDPKKFRSVAEPMEHYLQEQMQQQKEARNKDTMKENEPELSNESIFSQLSIHTAPYAQNTQRIARKASELLRNVTRTLHNKNTRHRHKDIHQDIEKNHVAYAAACFYIECCREQNSLDKKSKRRNQNFLSDIIIKRTRLTDSEFRKVYEYVKTIIEKTRDSSKDGNQIRKFKKRKDCDEDTRTDVKIDNEDAFVEQVIQICTNDEDVNTPQFHVGYKNSQGENKSKKRMLNLFELKQSYRVENISFSQSYLEWRRDVLEKAKSQKKDMIESINLKVQH